MDWKTWVAVGLCIVGLFLWQHYYTEEYQKYELARRQHLLSQQASQPANPTETQPEDSSTSPSDEPSQPPSSAPNPSLEPELLPQSETLSANDAQYVFNNDTGGIEEVILLLHLAENREAVHLNRDRSMPIGALGNRPGEALGGFHMSVSPDQKQVTFTRTDPDGLRITKQFTLPKDKSPAERYTLRLQLQFTNQSPNPLHRPGYYLSAGSAAPIHTTDLPYYTRFDWYRQNRMHSIDVNWFSPGYIPLLGIQTRPAREIYSESAQNISWVAVTSQYFCTILTSTDNRGTSVWARRTDTHRSPTTPIYAIQGALGIPGFDLPPGQTYSANFTLFAGPKELAALQALRGGQDAILNFGWFAPVSEFLLWAMNRLHALVGNYAAAIILLTILIKLLLWPIQNHATQSMRRMSLLTPKMEELRTKYKDNPQKMNEELMKLYKEYGINPFSGCLPILIQIPIFFGFYSMLGVAIELRNASFLWIADLSQPDTVAHFLGLPINLLPLIMTATMLWQIAISPKSGDPVQQRIFYFMPILFLLFCYNYASALSLYWTTQNLFSILQLYLTRNQPLPTLEKKSTTARRTLSESKKSNKKSKTKPHRSP